MREPVFLQAIYIIYFIFNSILHVYGILFHSIFNLIINRNIKSLSIYIYRNKTRFLIKKRIILNNLKIWYILNSFFSSYIRRKKRNIA